MKYLESSVWAKSGEFPYICFGSGKKKLVVIIGMNMTGLAGLGDPVSELYRDYVDEYTVYVFDRPNVLKEDTSIRSMAQDTGEAMRALGIDKADVIGVSQGGMIGLYLAIDYPELVHAFVCCSSCSYQNEIGKETLSLWLRLAEQRDGNNIYRDFFTRVYTNQNETALALCLDTSTDDQCNRFKILAHACLNFDCRDELSKVRCPVFVIGGKHDRVLGSTSSIDLAERLNCEYFIYQDYGHAVYDEAPDFQQRILDFLHKFN